MRWLCRLLLALILSAAPAGAETPWKLVKSYPHDPKAFTQGLIFLDGVLYESTGQMGQSQVRRVRLADGKVLQKADVESAYFGEGLTDWGDELISLTWRHQTGFRWKRDKLQRVGNFHYDGEGWGLTQDGKRLILSDGTARLRFLDPETLAQTGSVEVTYRGRPLKLLNELEYVKGEVLANIWLTSLIARINPDSGEVIDFIDLTLLVQKQRLTDFDAVLNGIAYDKVRDRLFVTGKYWPRLYEISIKR